jgi:thiol-disulfide isomerase/thioredoxin
MKPSITVMFLSAAVFAPPLASARAQGQVVTATLEYRAPDEGLARPNFSPKGTQIPLAEVSPSAPLPEGSIRPAKMGVVKVGPSDKSWIPVLVTADPAHPADLTRLYLDRNRNGNFSDDGPALTAAPSLNAKTHAWWTSIGNVTLPVSYGAGRAEPFLVNFWSVREDSGATPDIIRYSTGSWRAGTVTVNGIPALVAMMDDNDAVFDQRDMWSVVSASVPNAEKAVLTLDEARATSRLMFLTGDFKDVPLKFLSVTPDGREMKFEVLSLPLTKSADRAPDDLVRDERPRPRASTPVQWGHGTKGFNAALAGAKKSGKKILLDFEAVWCGPCHTMDQWIWNDAEVAGEISASYLGVKIDVDDEKGLVNRFKTTGYPTMIILDASGKEVWRVSDYQSSKQMLETLRRLK